MLRSENTNNNVTDTTTTKTTTMTTTIIQKILFTIIDPIIRQLCTILQQQFIPLLFISSSSSLIQQEQQQQQPMILVDILKDITKQLEELYNTIQSFMNDSKNDGDNNITTTLQYLNKKNNSNTSTTTKKKLQQIQMILDSILQKNYSTNNHDDKDNTTTIIQQQQQNNNNNNNTIMMMMMMIRRTALMSFVDYIMIPIVTLLRTLAGNTTTNNNNTTTNTSIPIIQIWNRHHHQSTTKANTTNTTNTTITTKHQQQQHISMTVVLQSYIWKSCIVSCQIISLLIQSCFISSSSVQQQQQQHPTFISSTTTTTTQSTTTRTRAIGTHSKSLAVVNHHTSHTTTTNNNDNTTTNNRIVHAHDNNNIDDDYDQKKKNYKKLISYMNVCLLILPSGPIIREHFFSSRQNNITTSVNSPSITIVSQLNDHGEQCLGTIITTIQVIIDAIRNIMSQQQQQSSSSFRRRITNIIYNIPHPCMIRILDTCIAIIEPISTTTTTTPTIQQQNILNNIEESISYTIQVYAMETIHTLLHISISYYTKYPNTTSTSTKQQQKDDIHHYDWTCIFPGIYTGIYRRLLYTIQSQQQQKSTSNIGGGGAKKYQHEQIILLGLQIMTNLIYHCCCNCNNSSTTSMSSSSSSSSSTSMKQIDLIALSATAESSASVHPQQNQHPSSSISVLQQLKTLSLAAATIVNNEDDVDKNTENNNTTIGKVSKVLESNEFICQVRQRLPSTLIVLINTLSKKTKMIQQKHTIQKQMIHLSRVILIDTINCWVYEEHDLLIITCFESLLLLLRHNTYNNDDATPSVESVINEYLQLECNSNNKRRVMLKMGLRITELLEGLPSFLQGMRDEELYRSIQLICKYLQYLPQKEVVRPLLSLETTQSTIRRIIVNLLDIQFEIRDPYQLGTVVLNFVPNQHQTSANTHPFCNAPQRQFMSDSLVLHTKEMLQIYGASIGLKHVTILIDTYVADLYRSCMERVGSLTNTGTRGQIQWIHKWIGIIPLIQHIMIGGFKTNNTSSGNAQMHNQNMLKYRERFLIPLLKSVFPILTTYPLWELSNYQIVNTSSPSIDNYAVSAFRGNVAMTCSLLEFVTSAIELLHDDMHVHEQSMHLHRQQFNSILLYPILDKMSQQNSGAVREAAYHALQALTKLNQCTNNVTLIADNIESCLIGPMLRRLRIPGGRSLQPDTPIDHDTICVLHCAITIIRISQEACIDSTKHNINSQNQQRCPSMSSSPVLLSSIQNLVTQLTRRFDYASTIIIYDVTACLQYVQLFDVTLDLIQARYSQCKLDSAEACSKGKNQVQDKDDEDTEPWFRLLDSYKKRESEDDKLNPKEGFEKYWKDKSELIVQNVTTNHTSSVSTDPNADINYHRDVKFCSYVLWRCGYLLSHPSLDVQLSVCEVYVKCFQWLGYIASNASIAQSSSNTSSTQPDSDENNTTSNQKPETAVLRQVHSSWPSIALRLKSASIGVVEMDRKASIQPLSSLLLVGEAMSSNATPKQKITNGCVNSSQIGQHRLFLCKLLHVTTVMIENTGDFMFSRLRDVLFPSCVLPLLSYFSNGSRQNICNVSNRRHDQASHDLISTMDTSNLELLRTLLNCVKRIFQYRPMANILENMIPTIGQFIIDIIFPKRTICTTTCTLHKTQDEVHLIGIDILRYMIHVNADMLYRPLSQLLVQSGLHEEYLKLLVKPCPLLAEADLPSSYTSNISTKPMTLSLQQQQVYDLFQLILTLPEQIIY